MGNIPSFPFSPHTREAGFVCYVSHFGSADTLNNPYIILISESEREREREKKQRDSTLIPGISVLPFQAIKHTLTPEQHKMRMCVCVCVYACVIAEKASRRRARQFIGGVSWPESSVQVRQTTQQVVVQRFGLTSDRKAAPRPPVPAASTPKSTKLHFSRAAPCV